MISPIEKNCIYAKLLTMIDRDKQAKYFEGLLDKHGPNYAALDWNSQASQELRYQIFAEIFLYGKKSLNVSLLDLGCGLGDLYGYLKKNNLLERHKIKYTGYDVSTKLLEAARKKYPEAAFAAKDILVEKESPCFDYIFCSGVFNIRTESSERHIESVRLMLQKMYDLIHAGVAANFLSIDVIPLANKEDLNSGRYFFFKPEEVLAWCRKLCRRYILRHDYHPGDFTIFMLK